PVERLGHEVVAEHHLDRLHPRQPCHLAADLLADRAGELRRTERGGEVEADGDPPTVHLDLVEQAQLGDGRADLGVLDRPGDPAHPLPIDRIELAHRDSVPATPVSTAGCPVPGTSVGSTAGWPARY